MPDAANRYLSPLRYPGGKGRLTYFVGCLISSQPRRARIYIEPFAGGAGVALGLLHGEYVEEVVLNDLDIGIAAFWRAVLDQPNELAYLIGSCLPTIDEWHRQNEIYRSREGDDLQLGFATFFLNRTNRSGILDARPIGGLEQRGKWGIDARWNAEQLSSRIRRIARYRSRVTVCQQDGTELARAHIDDPEAFIYADPPYLSSGDDLYFKSFSWDSHRSLAETLRNGRGWILTYDDDPRIPTKLYPGLRCASYGIAHTASTQHIGREYAVFADGLILNSLEWLGRGDAELLSQPTAPRTP